MNIVEYIFWQVKQNPHYYNRDEWRNKLIKVKYLYASDIMSNVNLGVFYIGNK